MEIKCTKCGNLQEYNPRRIKYLREKLGISQVELARMTRIPQQTISRIERGISNSSFPKVVKIFSFLFTEKQRKDSDTNTDNIPDFDLIADKILNLLKNWESLSEDTITMHLQLPGWKIWTILKKLKATKKVKYEHSEWQLTGEV